MGFDGCWLCLNRRISDRFLTHQRMLWYRLEMLVMRKVRSRRTISHHYKRVIKALQDIAKQWKNQQLRSYQGKSMLFLLLIGLLQQPINKWTWEGTELQNYISDLNQMNFYEREDKAISHDEHDNAILKQLTQKYADLQQKYQELQLNNTSNLKEIEQLRETNNKLIKEIAQLKADHLNEQSNLTTAMLYHNKTDSHFFMPQKLGPTILNKTIQRTIHAQQTKRRVINGFVEELTQQLQHSEDLLRKERIMQDQTRRTLSVCSQQLLSLKVTMQGLQNQIHMLTHENQQLLCELETSIHQKRLLQGRLTTKTLQCKKLKGTFMINVEQFENEMIKMDNIYKNIELELETMH